MESTTGIEITILESIKYAFKKALASRNRDVKG